MLDHQDKYMMKDQVHMSKSSAISDVQPLPRRKHYCQIYQMVKENQEKDKIGSKPNQNGKRVEAEKSLKQLQWVEEEKLNKTQKEGPKMQIRSRAIQV
nr:hypothetical protein [Tanacetum cinerariifolium]